ncbi:hypothetical protein HKX48_001777 [Thoreauomyces humboldtii]|nr:hypothetical protein HKX48_001777 [Thoreauomyces humboldtii]
MGAAPSRLEGYVGARAIVKRKRRMHLGHHSFLVVETKALHPGAGPTASACRTKARKDVQARVQRYTNAWAKQYPDHYVVGQSCVDREWGPLVYLTPEAVQSLMQVQRGKEDIEAEEMGMGFGSKLAVTAGILGIAGLLFKAVKDDNRSR